MPLPKVSLIMRTQGGVRQEEIVAGAGTSIEVSLDDDNGVGVGVDYTNSEALKLRLEGRVKMRVLGHGIEAKGTLLRDLDTEELAFDGTLELEIDKDVAASMTTNISPSGKTLNGALKITF